MGYLYRPKHPPKGKKYAEAKAEGTLQESSVYWVKYYVNGKAVRESTGSEKESDATRRRRCRTERMRNQLVRIGRTDSPACCCQFRSATTTQAHRERIVDPSVSRVDVIATWPL